MGEITHANHGPQGCFVCGEDFFLFFNMSWNDSPVSEKEVWGTNTAQGFSQTIPEPFGLKCSSVLILCNKGLKIASKGVSG